MLSHSLLKQILLIMDVHKFYKAVCTYSNIIKMLVPYKYFFIRKNLVCYYIDCIITQILFGKLVIFIIQYR